MIKKFLSFAAVTALVLTTGVASAGTLFVGADVEDFAQTGTPNGSANDRLGVVTTSGATVVSSTIIPTTFLLNGMADAGGVLLTGTPEANTLNTVGFDGTLISSIAAPGIPNTGCCNEEMLFVPQAGGGSKVYHAHYGNTTGDGIREIDPTTGVQIGALFPRTDVVGMALIKGDIWITRWANKEIGIWDPSTNIFSVQFDLDTLGLGGLGNAGALAWDPGAEVLWLGTQGGIITPFDLSGNVLGPSYQPFGTGFSATVDGLTFLGEVTEVPMPEPTTLAIVGLGLAAMGLARRRRAAA